MFFIAIVLVIKLFVIFTLIVATRLFLFELKKISFSICFKRDYSRLLIQTYFFSSHYCYLGSVNRY